MKAKKIVKKINAKPDFHVTDRILFFSLMLLLFTASASMAATQSGLSTKSPSAKIVISKTKPVPPAPANASCGHKLLISGKTTPESSLLKGLTGSATNYAKINAVLDSGCPLRVVKNGGLGGGSGRTAFDCGVAFTEDGDNVLHCLSYQVEMGGGVINSKASFAFDGDNVSYFENGNTLGEVDVKLYQY